MLKLRNVEAFYGKIQALRRISFGVPEGSIVALLGANGAGKTTTLRVISGVIRASKGSVEFMGEDITKLAPEKIVRKGIIHCPEGRQIFPELTVLENLRIGAYPRKDKANIKSDLDKVYEYFPRLFERQSQMAGTLSGGEQQMLAIGRALMGKPKLLLLDEPSLGLAPIIVEQIFQVIQEINKRDKTTILLVEQNVYKALSISDFGFILETGKITLGDKADALLQNDEVKAAYLGGDRGGH
jgi:branched-chain amino acid transport system ATP-binding protein